MSSFVVTENNDSAEEPISNDVFFPEINPADYRLAMREDKSVTPERLKTILIEAMISVNQELAALKDSEAQTLSELPSGEIDGTKITVHRYRRAVYSFAKAELLERYIDQSATNAGESKNEAKQLTADEHRRNARWAISDLLGTPRITVELI